MFNIKNDTKTDQYFSSSFPILTTKYANKDFFLFKLIILSLKFK